MLKNIVYIPIDSLDDYEAQPFKVTDDEKMQELADSIKELGVLTPITVRPRPDGRYEIISGHRRKRACELIGLEEIPAIITELDDDEAAIMLVDSNLQRENILPSERAYAYKLKLEALKHQGKKNSTFGHFVRKSETTDEIGLDSGKSGRQIRRYIRLTNLIYQILDKVDEGIIPVTAGAEISFLDVRTQVMLNDVLDYECCSLSLMQAVKIKEHFLVGDISQQTILEIVEEKENKNEGRIALKYDKLKKYFPESYSAKECEEALWKILDEWFENDNT